VIHVDPLADQPVALKLQHHADPVVHQLAALKSVLAIHVQHLLAIAVAVAVHERLEAVCSPRFSVTRRAHAAIAAVQQLAMQHQLVAARADHLLYRPHRLLQLLLQHQWLTHMLT